MQESVLRKIAISNRFTHFSVSHTCGIKSLIPKPCGNSHKKILPLQNPDQNTCKLATRRSYESVGRSVGSGPGLTSDASFRRRRNVFLLTSDDWKLLGRSVVGSGKRFRIRSGFHQTIYDILCVDPEFLKDMIFRKFITKDIDIELNLCLRYL